MKSVWTVILTLGLAALVFAEEAARAPIASPEQAQRFAAEMKALAQTDQPVVRGAEDWLFLPSELRHLGVGAFWGEHAAEVSRAGNPDWADPLPVIVDFQRQLKSLGVDLVVVPVPPKAVIYPERVSPTHVEKLERESSATPRLDSAHQQFYAKLREQGVEVLDMTDAFLAEKSRRDRPLYCRTDTHWATRAIDLTAEALARRIIRYELLMDAFALEAREITIDGDLRRMAKDDSIGKESRSLTFVGRKPDGPMAGLGDDETSPVLLLGDSHLLVFHVGGDMHAKGAGLADHLALHSGVVPDVIAVRGSGATPARISLARKNYRDPEYLKSKKLVIWVFTAREFTETSGWRPIPIVKPTGR